MKATKSKLLLIVMLCLIASCTSAEQGCSNPQVTNYDSLATEEDHSSKYQIPFVSPEWSKELVEQINETSGLILWDGFLWTINDDTDTRLYKLDTATAEIRGTYMLPAVDNQDWEDLAQDEEFIYIGDFGNNMGNRRDLNILRIEKVSLKNDQPAIDTIWFSFSDQRDFNAGGLNITEFDCEAFMVSSDSIYIFTKQWSSGFTTQYVLPKLPGRHTAQKRANFNTEGQVTGATYQEQERLLVLCGYAGLMQPFLYFFYDFQGDDFFSGIQRRVNLSLPFHQVEGICTEDGINFFVSNEHVEAQSYINIPQKLHKIDLSESLEEFLKGEQ